MDKYQLKLIERNKQLSLDSVDGNGKVEITDLEIILTQNENYNVEKYILTIVNDAIEVIKIDEEEIKGNERFEIPIDFSKKSNKITVIFKNGFANPCDFALKYVDADKESYDQKVIAQTNANYLANMNVLCKTGLDLVNIYWNKSSNKYKYTKISLFVYSENKKNEYIFMQDFIIKDEIFYKSITGLAFGEYKINIGQYDSENNLVVSTEVTFKINNKLETITKMLDALGKSSAPRYFTH